MVTGFQEAGSGSAQPAESCPTDWHSVTLAVFYGSEPSQRLPKFKGVGKETPSLNERVARSHGKRAWGMGNITADIFEK